MLAWAPRLLILAIVSSAGLTGCATIATGGVQAINIQSQPSGAECSLTRGGQSLGSLVTPGQITVSRSGQAIKVTCRKAGYQDTGEFLVATREPLALLDSVPVVGVVTLPARAVDMASGADAQFPRSAQGVAGPQRCNGRLHEHGCRPVSGCELIRRAIFADNSATRLNVPLTLLFAPRAPLRPSVRGSWDRPRASARRDRSPAARRCPGSARSCAGRRRPSAPRWRTGRGSPR